MTRRRPSPPTPAPQTVPDLIAAPELAAIILLEHALDVATSALLAAHLTLTTSTGPASRAASSPSPMPSARMPAPLCEVLKSDRRAVRDAAIADADCPPNHDIPF